jgi:hypothetical protein
VAQMDNPKGSRAMNRERATGTELRVATNLLAMATAHPEGTTEIGNPALVRLLEAFLHRHVLQLAAALDGENE